MASPLNRAIAPAARWGSPPDSLPAATPALSAFLRPVLTLGLAGAMVVALPAGSAAAGSVKDASIKGGVLSADGAAAKVPATFRCPQGYDAFLTIQLIQALGQKFAGGFDQATKKCTGRTQKITFYLQAVPAENTRPFRAGPASARMILDAVDPAFAGEPFFEEEPPPAEPELLPPLPFTPQAIVTDAGTTEAAPQVHAEDRRTINLRKR